MYDYVVTFFLACLCAYAWHRSKISLWKRHEHTIAALESRIDQLEAAAATLTAGPVSMCSTCRKVRSPGETWEPVEAFMHQQLCLEVSHGFCPDCADAFVADFKGNA